MSKACNFFNPVFLCGMLLINLPAMAGSTICMPDYVSDASKLSCPPLWSRDSNGVCNISPSKIGINPPLPATMTWMAAYNYFPLVTNSALIADQSSPFDVTNWCNKYMGIRIS